MTKQHKFEVAGLGQSPYRFVGSSVEKYQACHGAPIQPGASCDFCGQGIMQVFWFKSADGRTFKVGCDCAEKAGEKSLIKAELSRLDKEKRDSRDEAKKAEIDRLLAIPEVQERLQGKPHPFIVGYTLLDYATYVCKNAGASGRSRLLSMLKRYDDEQYKGHCDSKASRRLSD